MRINDKMKSPETIEISGLFCRVSTEKMHSFRIHLNQFIGDMPALCYEYPVKVLPHPFFW